jgi:hypothetical protein
MKPNIVIYLARGATGQLTRSLVEHLAFLSAYSDKYDFVYVTKNKTFQCADFITEVTGIQFAKKISIDEVWQKDVQSNVHPTWLNFMKKRDWFGHLENVKHIVLASSLLSEATGWTRRLKQVNKHVKVRNQMLFVSNSKPFATILQLMKLAQKTGAHFHEIAFDPDEYSMDLLSDVVPLPKHTLYHGYDIPEYGAKRLDAIQYYLMNGDNPLEAMFSLEDKKEFDLVFGYTAVTPGREKFHDKVDTLLTKYANKLSTRTFVYHRNLGINTLVDRPVYLDFIRRSKFTLMLPAYDTSQFSYIRFIESIHNNCLPLLGNDVMIDAFAKSYGFTSDDFNEIRHNYSTLPRISEKLRIDLLSRFKEKLFTPFRESHTLVNL